jgi:hypothetical protein
VPPESDYRRRQRLRLPSGQQPNVYARNSALIGIPSIPGIPSNNQNVLFNDPVHSNIQQQLMASSYIGQSDSDTDLFQPEYLSMTSRERVQIPFNDLDMQRQMMNDIFSEAGDIYPRRFDQQQSNILLQQQHASQLNVFHPNVHERQSQFHHQQHIQHQLQQQQQQQQQQLAFPSSAAHMGTPGIDNDNNNNMSYSDQMLYSTFTLGALEPTPIGGNATKKEDSSPEDTKPHAKR